MKRKGALLLSLTLALLVAVGAITVLVQAVWNEEEAVHITPSEIEDSTLAIGTHLIHLSALTNELYEIASDSADESGQTEIYYKSELSAGTWFNITTASSLEDITTGGTPVLDSEIEELFFTHHTKSDGVTYDLRTGQPVNPYDIVDPYDIETFDELLPLKNQYEIIKEMQGESAAGKEKIQKIEEVLRTEVKNAVTDECDANLAALQQYYDELAANNAPADQLDAVQEVMNAVDATRRAEVFTTLEAVLNEFTQSLPRIEDTAGTSEAEGSEGRAPDTELQSAANDSLSNVQTSLIEYQGKMLSEGTTVMSALRYEFSLDLISDANAGSFSSCDTDVQSLIHLSNISSSIVANKDGELALLDDTILPRATDAYHEGLRAGVSTEYVAAAAADSSSALLNNLISTAASTVNTARNELESYITAKVLRLSNSEGRDFINERLAQAQDYYTLIPNDDFSESMRGTVDSHIEFLTDKLRELELAAGGNELDQLLAEKGALQTDYMSALDNNDLAGAKDLEDQIAALDERIDALQSEQSAALSAAQEKLSELEDQLANATEGSSEAADLERQIAEQKSEIAALESNMSDGTLGELVAELRAEALSIIGETSEDDPLRETLDKDIDTLASLLDQNVGLVFPALEDIHEALAGERDINGDSSYDDAIEAVEEAILGSRSAYESALKGEVTTDQLEQAAEDFFAGSSSSLLDSATGSSGSGDGTDPSGLTDEEESAVYLAALEQFLDAAQSGAAEQLIGALSQKQMNLGNPLVFLQAEDPASEYIPVSTLARSGGMRYVWNQNKSQGTLAKGSQYYIFAAYSDLVQRGKTESSFEQMARAARLQGSTLYIPEDYTVSALGIQAEYLTGTSYAVALNEKLAPLAEALCERFLSI